MNVRLKLTVGLEGQPHSRNRAGESCGDLNNAEKMPQIEALDLHDSYI